MNINIVREEIKKNIGKKVIVSVYGLRNRHTKYEGIISGLYPNIFTVRVNSVEKSFPYRDLITGDVKIKYL